MPQTLIKIEPSSSYSRHNCKWLRIFHLMKSVARISDVNCSRFSGSEAVCIPHSRHAHVRGGPEFASISIALTPFLQHMSWSAVGTHWGGREGTFYLFKSVGQINCFSKRVEYSRYWMQGQFQIWSYRKGCYDVTC